MSIRIEAQPNGVVEVVFGPAGALPVCDPAAHADLGRLWGRIAQDPQARVILVRSEGKGFSAGGEIGLRFAETGLGRVG